MAKKITIIVSVILLVFLGIYIYAGGLSKATVTNETLPAMTIAAVHLTADEMHKEKEQSETKMAKLRNSLKSLGLFDDSTATYISISYNDTTATESGLNQFIAGFILADEVAQQVRERAQHIPIVSLPAAEAHVSRFTQKGVLSLLIGMQKQYKAMNKIIEKEKVSKNTPTIHIIDFTSKENSYILPSAALVSDLNRLSLMVKNWKSKTPAKETPITAPETPEA